MSLYKLMDGSHVDPLTITSVKAIAGETHGEISTFSRVVVSYSKEPLFEIIECPDHKEAIDLANKISKDVNDAVRESLK